ncbi:MAG: hypothetical protein GY778_05935 [bacterium]|nr:hypothetical protein [bacterium]
MNPLKTTLLATTFTFSSAGTSMILSAQPPAIPTHGDQLGYEAPNPTAPDTQGHTAGPDTRLADPSQDCNSNGIPDDVDISAVEWAKLTASDAADADYFGRSVSVSGDIAVIGAIWDDAAGNNSGSAYVYRYDGNAWVEEARLTPSDGAADDHFGHSVSVNGDLAVIGAHDDDDAGSSSGSAYVYRHNGSSWVEEAKLTASDAAGVDYFGYAVSISGDLAVIGAYGNDDAGNESGSAYVYRYNGSTWVGHAKLTASDAADNDRFGYSVSVNGDLAVIGAYRDDDAGDYSGAAYLYRYNGSSWTEEVKLIASDAAAYDNFGISVSVNGDLAVVGARGDDDQGSMSGSAYVYCFDGIAWVEDAKLTASDAAADDRFGYSVSVNGDLAVIGALIGYDAGSWSGSAYVYRNVGGVWLEQSKLTASDAGESHLFGISVSISGHLVAIGAHGDDDAGSNSGSAYVFSVESFDCNGNGIPDECEPAQPDCNSNGIADGCDILLRNRLSEHV